MKIGIDARLWNETGVGRYIRNLVRELSSLETTHSYVLFVKDPDIVDRKIVEDKRWKVVPTSIHWHSLEEQLKFASLLYKENLDVMHFPYFSLPLLYNRPFVVTIHDLIIHHFPTGKASTLPYPIYQAKRVAFERVLKHGIQKSQKIIVPLTSVKEDICKSFKVDEEKIVVTYEGVDGAVLNSTSYKKKHNQKAEKYFLYVGNAYPHKNVEGLLQGFAEYKKQYTSEMKLYMVGKEDYFSKRIEKELSLELASSVRFLHAVSDEELSALYRNAKAFVSASFMEGFGLPPLEALSNNCLPVLSDIPSFREVCSDVAIYFNPRSPEDIARALNDCVNLPSAKRERLLAKGRKRVSDFSWKTMARQTRKVYEEAVV